MRQAFFVAYIAASHATKGEGCDIPIQSLSIKRESLKSKQNYFAIKLINIIKSSCYL